VSHILEPGAESTVCLSWDGHPHQNVRPGVGSRVVLGLAHPTEGGRLLCGFGCIGSHREEQDKRQGADHHSVES